MGLIFIKLDSDLAFYENIIGFFDNTDAESSLNHIHINDAFGMEIEKEMHSTIKAIGDIWACKLKNEFPGHKFRIYLTFEDDYVIRFHQIHENEPYWLEERDWQEKIAAGDVTIWEVK